MTTVTNTDTPSQLDQQLELLCSFNVQIPCNPQGEFAKSSFKTLLQSLNTNQICDSLRGFYHDVHLKKWKEYAQWEFNEMPLNSRDCRIFFMRHLSALKIQIRASNLPLLRIWVNGPN